MYTIVNESIRLLSTDNNYTNGFFSNEKISKSVSIKKKYGDKNSVPRPSYWSGWNLKPSSIEFWLDGDNRIHERLKYSLDEKNNWIKSLLSP